MKKSKKGSFSIFLVLVLPAIFFVVLIIFAKQELFTFKMELKGYMDVAIETATDNAMVLYDEASSQHFCLILNSSSGRNKTYKIATESFMRNLETNYLDEMNRDELIIESIGTNATNNAWG